MNRTPPAASPTAYVANLTGWRRALVTRLRTAVRAAAPFDEVVKWGHLVYLAEGPVLLIRAETQRVLFGFWRGQRLTSIEPRLKPGGKYEMATLELHQGDDIEPAVARRLARAAFDLARELGDATLAARPAARPARRVTPRANQPATTRRARARKAPPK